QNDVTLKMPAFEWVHVQLHQQKGMISLSPPTICNSALIYSITQIDHVAVMTRGGPDNATTVLLYYIQNLTWDTHDLGKASAATFLTLAGLFAFSLINLKLLEKGAHYER
ncbi:hypothetical protein QS822_25445, partial [Escherichia coli]|nr:hypothetical protein [Escherichia coli]